MSEIKIEDLEFKNNIEDDNLIIIEDKDDTKKSNILELKRSLIGDGIIPSQYKVYSSKFVQSLINQLQIQMSNLPSQSDMEILKNNISNIIINNEHSSSATDMEVMLARGQYPTLSQRLDGDSIILNSKFISYPKDEYYGMKVDLSKYPSGTADITIPNSNISEPNIYLYLDIYNRLDLTHNDVVNNNGNTITVYNNDSIKYHIENKSNYIGSHWLYITTLGYHAINGGSDTYYIYSSLFSNKPNINIPFISFKYTDGTIEKIPYNGLDFIKFKIDKNKLITAIRIEYDNNSIPDDGCDFNISGFMISKYPNLNKFYKNVQNVYSFSPSGGQVSFDVSNVVSVFSENFNFKTTILDTSCSGNEIRKTISYVNDIMSNSIDHCGLLKSKGKYIFTNNMLNADNEFCSISTDYDKTRNGVPSSKIQFMDIQNNTNPRFSIILDNPINIIESNMISIQIYIDSTTYEYFSDTDGIQLMLSSDNNITQNPSVNYYHINFGRKSFVQGWNTLKFKKTELKMHGSPNGDNITTIQFKIYSTEVISGKNIWINSIILGQYMQPTVLLAFDNFYESAFDYQYPLLYSKNIPATIFGNDKTTLTKDQIQKISILKYQYGWDLGNYGCNPNKDIMLQDNNPRDQYIALKNTKQYLLDNFSNEIISYAAPFGNLRPISMPILKDLGFKIAKVDSTSYCSFFGENDFSIPMHLLSNDTTAEKMIEKIKYIIETGQTICIYTNNVTKYGDEISAKKDVFETVINFIYNKIEENRLQCLTFSEFYKKCIN